ncbi:phosphodiester glycosidase family protein [Leptolyngbya sp. CCNP1308]|uniref:phosphodiester glycosidase family protein n=1 Tax=Leptolyngbya sp. CCNP1308 TaxID=3110255 RepID=UPI002B216074|nr:phosphodiester glycosidase family protein [Leptolyngbya sp. CCNP1308]MEA5447684.1 phosphodiester glycosidase family protein [Leptolyngbya sp. CCNP1308]
MRSTVQPSLAVGLAVALGLSSCAPVPDGADAALEDAVPAQPAMPPVYETVRLPSAIAHVMTIPDPVRYPVQVAVVNDLARVDQIVSQVCEGEGCAAAAINAGFFDPNNGLTTSYVMQDGALVADPNQNDRLIGNPDLTSYMDRILNRSEFRRYDCGGTPSYDITFHQEPVPAGCALVDAVGAGPQLLPQDTSVEEGFIDRTVARDALGSQSPNARSAVGLKADGSVVLVMVAEVPGVSPSGMTMAEVAGLMGDRGVTQALNLDGGSSSTLMYDGTTHYGRLNSAGDLVQRPVKSILWVANPDWGVE